MRYPTSSAIRGALSSPKKPRTLSDGSTISVSNIQRSCHQYSFFTPLHQFPMTSSLSHSASRAIRFGKCSYRSASAISPSTLLSPSCQHTPLPSFKAQFSRFKSILCFFHLSAPNQFAVNLARPVNYLLAVILIVLAVSSSHLRLIDC